MPNSQNQENPDNHEDRQTTGFGIGQALTAAAASLRAAGTRAQELVEGTTNAVLSSLPLNRIRATEPRPLSTANNNAAIENQTEKNVLTLDDTQSRPKLNIKRSCTIKNELAEEISKGTENLKASALPTGEATSGHRSAGQSGSLNNNFFKGSSVIKTNLQFEQTKETTKGTETLRAPAVQTPAGQSELWNIDFFKGAFIIKSNIKPKLTEGTAKAPEKLNRPLTAGEWELPYIHFFKTFSSVKTNIYIQQAEETAKRTEKLKTPTAQTTTSQSESRLQLPTSIEKAGTSVEPLGHEQSNLQSTGTQTEETNGSVANTLNARKQITGKKASFVKQVSKTRKLDALTQEETFPSFFTESRLLNLASKGSPSSRTRQLIDTPKTKRIVSSQPESTFDFKVHHRHTNISQRSDINFIHGPSSERVSRSAIPTSSSRRISSQSRRSVISTQPNFTSHTRTWESSSKLSDLSLHRRKARRLSEVVEQRRWISVSPKKILASQDSPTEIVERNIVLSISMPAVPKNIKEAVPQNVTQNVRETVRENVRGQIAATETRATDMVQNQERKSFLKAVKQFFGRCTGRRQH